jgi:hypothetical protein
MNVWRLRAGFARMTCLRGFGAADRILCPMGHKTLGAVHDG